MDGQANAVAWLRTWISSWRGSIRSTSDHAGALVLQLLDQARRSPRRVPACPRRRGTAPAGRRRAAWRRRAAGTARPSAGCSGPQRRRSAAPGRCPGRGRRRRLRRGCHRLDVDAVVDHPDLGRVHLRVAAQDVLAHALRHGDDRRRRLVGGLLHPGGEGVAAAELLGLPGPQRLQAVGAEHVRDAVQQRGQVSGHVGVPGVRMRPGPRRRCPGRSAGPRRGSARRRWPRPGPPARRRTSRSAPW